MYSSRSERMPEEGWIWTHPWTLPPRDHKFSYQSPLQNMYVATQPTMTPPTQVDLEPKAVYTTKNGL